MHLLYQLGDESNEIRKGVVLSEWDRGGGRVCFQIMIGRDQPIPRVSDNAELEKPLETPGPKDHSRILRRDMARRSVPKQRLGKRQSPSLGDVEENGFQGDHLLDPIALWATQGIDPHLSAQGVAQGAGKVGDPANVSHVEINRV